ncbi:MAG: hypothetical protein ACP5E6_16965 [Acidiphilium sp.]
MIHPDDAAIDDFALALKLKMAEGRARGRGGWQTCPVPTLGALLQEAVMKGDPRDVATYAMMIWHNTPGRCSPFNDGISRPADLVCAEQGRGKESVALGDLLQHRVTIGRTTDAGRAMSGDSSATGDRHE